MREWADKVLEWLLAALLWLPRKIWQLLLEGLAAIINAIPVPDFLSGLGTAWAAIGGPIFYFLDIAQFDVGLPMVLGAWMMRFLLRRVPVIG